MPAFIRQGDKTSSGGTVLEGSDLIEFDDIPVARKGDKVSCPKHGETTIAEGSPDYLDDGRAVALNGHRCACGCTLISSFSAGTVD
ncbi:PAAR domain-containing protein [Photorhabdus heterorhabditis]|uniref:PAAR domain-containing protein n=1 Tax=Photorhabdus heterorhabditis TaxID=880156 RepID=A0ABR5K7A5_9GAMM|nr:PAAR domain-containing protein [Photorhabdus heterorhabditis]KOY60252.1 hypothetical protein AM629_20390 [Photorhabdus heterorhabditis]MBS9443982.1 PAAR domain-containing protein [Photorhabdus heterorhabditis]